MNRRLIIIIAIALVVLIGITTAFFATRQKQAGPAPKDDNITLTYWRPLDDSATFQPVIDEYQKTNPKVKIEYKKIPIKDYETQLLDAIASGRGPDLFSVGNAWMPKYFDKLAPSPEDKLSVADFEKAYYPIAAKDNIKDKRIYGIPYSIDTLALYYNTDLYGKADISEPPKTWDEVVGKPADPSRPSEAAKPSMLAKLNNRQGNAFKQSAIAVGNNQTQRSSDVLSLMMLQQRTAMTNDNRDQATFNLTQKVDGKDVHLGTEALRFYTSFADPRTPNYSWNGSLGDSVKAFAEGRTAMMVGYAYNIPTVERLNPNLKFDIAPVPQIGGSDPVNYASYWSEVVSKSSGHQDEAWEFIRFASEQEQLRLINENTKRIPARKEMGPPQSRLETFKIQAETAVGWYQADYSKAEAIFADMITQVLSGEDAQRAADNAANRQTEVLKAFKSGGTPRGATSSNAPGSPSQ